MLHRNARRVTKKCDWQKQECFIQRHRTFVSWVDEEFQLSKNITTEKISRVKKEI